MTSFDLKEIATHLPVLEVTPDIDLEEAMKAIKILGSFNDCMLGVVRFSGKTAWERHPAGEEMLHVLSGQTHITILSDEGPIHINASEGDLVTIPKGLWHTQCPADEVTLLFATPAENSERSFEENPLASS